MFDQDTIHLDPGDTIVVFSDGVSEALNAAGEEFGDGLLLDAVLAAGNIPAQALVERVIAAVREFTRGAAQSDDITVMVVRYLGPVA
jgi:sigma-B regulation protein RsbU (phosphoserine phosphatase)